MIKICLREEEKPRFLSPKQFEEEMGITYLPHLLFESEKLHAKIAKKCEKAL